MSNLKRISAAFVVMAGICAAGANAQASPYDDALATYKSGDFPKAMSMLKPLAEAGDPSAEELLAEVYWFGQGMPADPVTAVGLLRQAATLGDGDAQVLLGAAYLSGRGVEQDKARAVKLFEAALAKHNPGGAEALSAVYLRGDGVPKDNARAAAYLKEAADGGRYGAQWEYGVLQLRGLDGVAKDIPAAIRELTLSADQRYIPAELDLAIAYAFQAPRRDLVQAAAWAEVAVHSDCAAARSVSVMLIGLIAPGDRQRADEMADRWEQRHPPHPSLNGEQASRFICDSQPPRPA